MTCDTAILCDCGEGWMDKRVLSETQRDWLLHVEACGEAAISMKAYAESHGLDLKQFYAWKGRLRKLGAAPGKADPGQLSFAPVCVAPPEKITGKICIQLANGIKIEAPSDFNAPALAELLTAAMNLS